MEQISSTDCGACRITMDVDEAADLTHGHNGPVWAHLRHISPEMLPVELGVSARWHVAGAI